MCAPVERELWEKSLVDGREAPVMTDDYFRGFAQWSPDGTRLAYWRGRTWTGEGQIVEWSVESRIEEPLTARHGWGDGGYGIGHGTAKTFWYRKRQ